MGKFETCSACAEAKARQANIPKAVPDGHAPNHNSEVSRFLKIST